MDSEQGKLFVGGIAWETSEERLREYFATYGEVVSVVIMSDKVTGRPRGFGFVGFADPTVIDRVLADKHVIDGRTVEAKRALSREEQQTSGRSGNNSNARSSGGGPGANIRTKKIFVGGLPPTLTEDGFRQYFQAFGTVTDVVVMYDQNTQRPRGFGFITFDSEDSVDEVLQKTFHELDGKLVEVKRALPKEANPNSGGGRSAGGGGSYQSYGGSGGNNSYDGRMDANRYMQPQAAGGGFPSYGSSGYGAPGYGYGAATNGGSYGGYGGYGSAGAGYGGPGGAYGSHNASAGGYVSGPPGARNPWNSQAPTGYGSAGYGGGSTGYGAATSWNAPTGSAGSGAGPIGQSPNGAAGYGNPGYGYGGYGGSEGAYGSQSGYGSAMGRGAGAPGSNPAAVTGEQVGSYMSSGYGDANGNSGYANAWKSNPSQAGHYGVSQVNGPPGAAATYGGPQGRQAQQQ